jgi:hypothetical protein
MSKEISEKKIAAFRKECARLADNNLPFYSDTNKITQGYHRDGVSPKWEYCPDDERTYDIYDLLGSVADEFLIEECGYDEWIVSRKTEADKAADRMEAERLEAEWAEIEQRELSKQS